MAEPVTMDSFVREPADFDELISKLSFAEESATFAASQQPLLYLKAARARVQTMRAKMQTEAALEQVEAETARSIRDNAVHQGVKVTEAGIKESIALDPAVQDAQKAVRSATMKEELGKLLVEAYRHRRDAIKIIAESNLVEGHSQLSEHNRTAESAKVSRDARAAVSKRRMIAAAEDGEKD